MTRTTVKRGADFTRCIVGILLAHAFVLSACGEAILETGDTASVDVSIDANDVLSADGNDTAAHDAAQAETTDTTAPPTNACADSTVVLLDLAEVMLKSGESESLLFEVPPDTTSIAIVVEGIPGTTYAIGHWDTPTGFLVTPEWMDMPENQGGLCLSCALRVVPSEGSSAALTPNSPTSWVDPGVHQVSVLGFRFDGGLGGLGGQKVNAEGAVSVKVIAKVHGSLPSHGVLNLNLHFTGTKGWSAENALETDAIQAILANMADIYGQVGLSIGRIETFDVDPAFQVIESIQGPDSDLSELFRTASGAPDDAINVFFVDELIGPFGPGFGVLLGISGGIPGPVRSPGSARGGVAISTVDDPAIDADIGITTAHEVGHYLGLFHILEDDFGGFLPTTYDPLPDTPEENDTSWLMHFNGIGGALSEWQGIVLRSNPVICYQGGP